MIQERRGQGYFEWEKEKENEENMSKGERERGKSKAENAQSGPAQCLSLECGGPHSHFLAFFSFLLSSLFFPSRIRSYLIYHCLSTKQKGKKKVILLFSSSLLLLPHFRSDVFTVAVTPLHSFFFSLAVPFWFPRSLDSLVSFNIMSFSLYSVRWPNLIF